jgi:hypothetical protein
MALTGLDKIMEDSFFVVVTEDGDWGTGAVGDGIADDSDALQRIINWAYSRKRPVYFPSDTTYLISKTIRIERFNRGIAGGGSGSLTHRIVGGPAVGGKARPKIILKENCAGFQNASSPRPMIYNTMWVPLNSSGKPTGLNQDNGGDPQNELKNVFWPDNLNSGYYNGNPYIKDDWPRITVPATGITHTFGPWPALNLGGQFSSFDIDTNGNPGADALFLGTAQEVTLNDVKIKATGSNCGLVGGGGRAAIMRNLEIDGGKYAISVQLGAGQFGSVVPVYVGVKAYNQTVAVVRGDDSDGPPVFVGFDFTTNNIPVIESGAGVSGSSGDTYTFQDGKITEIGSTTNIPFINEEGRTFYIRNVFITGTNSVLKTPTTTHTATGTWKRIVEYCANEHTAASYIRSGSDSSISPSVHLIDGNFGITSEPISPIIEEDIASFSEDFVTFHGAIDRCAYYHEDMINVMNFTYGGTQYSAKNDFTDDCITIIEKAMEAAESEGHNLVFFPPGYFKVSRTVNMRKHTKFLGCGTDFGNPYILENNQSVKYCTTQINAAPEWKPTTENEYVISTPDDPDATCQIYNLTVMKTRVTQSSGNNTHLQRCILWRCGKNSILNSTLHHKPYETPSVSARVAHTNLVVTGNGGGIIYNMVPGYGEQVGNDDTRCLLVENTTTPLRIYGLQAEWPKYDNVTGESNVVFRNAKNIRCYGYKREGAGYSFIVEDCDNIAFSGHGGGPSVASIGYFLFKGTTSNTTFSAIQTKGIKDSSFQSGSYSQTGSNLTFTISSTNATIYVGEKLFIYITSGDAPTGLYTVISGTAGSFVASPPSALSGTDNSGNFKIFGKNSRSTLKEELDGEDKKNIPFPLKISIYRRGTLDDLTMEIPGWGTPTSSPATQILTLNKLSVAPEESFTFSISNPDETPSSATLNGVSVTITDGSSSGGTITMPNLTAFLTGVFSSTDWNTNQTLQINFPTADPVTANIQLKGPAGNISGSTYFWGKR